MLDRAVEKQQQFLTSRNNNEYAQYIADKQQKRKIVSEGKEAGKIKQNLLRDPSPLVIVPTTLVLDADVLRECLQYRIHADLFQIAFACEAVVCCRLSPNEKAILVSFSHLFYPELTTLAIGDGANDVPMIRAAQIGVGVAGREGLHACNSADLSVPEFRMLRRLILVHGHINHMRNAYVTNYSVFKNSINVFCSLFF